MQKKDIKIYKKNLKNIELDGLEIENDGYTARIYCYVHLNDELVDDEFSIGLDDLREADYFLFKNGKAKKMLIKDIARDQIFADLIDIKTKLEKNEALEKWENILFEAYLKGGGGWK